MTARELLLEPLEFRAPEPTLDGLSPDLADRRLEGASHSIAEIVAHLAFWQDWFSRRCGGEDAPMVERAAHGWPAVAPGSWLIVRQQFLGGLAGLVAWADAAGSLETPLAPAIQFPPLAQYSRRDALVHVANHNAHHLGQVILLRQLLGAWPPPAGSWTW
jgi:DinB family protein